MTTGSVKQRSAHWRRIVASTARWLHIYLSMVSFAVVLFFSVTGLTLNHPTWFADHQVTINRHGVADKALLQASGPDGADKLGIVEFLRSHEQVHGAATDFRADDSQISLSFRAPAYTADAFIDRSTGKYDLTIVDSGFVALLNDLHKGRDSGTSWGWLIDVSAVLLVFVSFTGLVILWFIHKRRTSGFLLAGVAAIVAWGLYHFLVP